MDPWALNHELADEEKKKVEKIYEESGQGVSRTGGGGLGGGGACRSPFALEAIAVLTGAGD